MLVTHSVIRWECDEHVAHGEKEPAHGVQNKELLQRSGARRRTPERKRSHRLKRTQHAAIGDPTCPTSATKPK